jgi:hypothetical protein
LQDRVLDANLKSNKLSSLLTFNSARVGGVRNERDISQDWKWRRERNRERCSCDGFDGATIAVALIFAESCATQKGGDLWGWNARICHAFAFAFCMTKQVRIAANH